MIAKRYMSSTYDVSTYGCHVHTNKPPKTKRYYDKTARGGGRLTFLRLTTTKEVTFWLTKAVTASSAVQLPRTW